MLPKGQLYHEICLFFFTRAFLKNNFGPIECFRLYSRNLALHDTIFTVSVYFFDVILARAFFKLMFRRSQSCVGKWKFRVRCQARMLLIDRCPLFDLGNGKSTSRWQPGGWSIMSNGDRHFDCNETRWTRVNCSVATCARCRCTFQNQYASWT